MNYFEIITTICSVLSVIIAIMTVVVTILIAKRQKLNQNAIEKQRKQDIETQHTHYLEMQAKIFTIENHNEIDYLQLCQFASWNHPYEQHTRKIFNNFNKCDIDIQKTILKMNKCVDLQLEKQDFSKTLNVLLERFVAELHKNGITKLAGDSFLYDGGKYFTRGFEHGKYKIEAPLDCDNNVMFELQFYHQGNENYYRNEFIPMRWRIEDYLSIKNNQMTIEIFKQRLQAQKFFPSQVNDVYKYLIPENYDEFLKLHQNSPVDHYFYLVSSIDEKECVYIIMNLINACIYNFEEKSNYKFAIEPYGSPETNEDLYYTTLCNLYHEYMVD